MTGLVALDGNNKTIGSILKRSADTSCTLFFIYAEKDLTVTGSITHSEEEDIFTETFNNMSLKAGWNKVYLKVTRNGYEYSTKEVSGLKWYLVTSSDEH
jgi:hypothetical protein